MGIFVKDSIGKKREISGEGCFYESFGRCCCLSTEFWGIQLFDKF